MRAWCTPEPYAKCLTYLGREDATALYLSSTLRNEALFPQGPLSLI